MWPANMLAKSRTARVNGRTMKFCRISIGVTRMYIDLRDAGQEQDVLEVLADALLADADADVEHVADQREDQRERELRHRRDLRERHDRHQVVRQDEEEQRGEERRERAAGLADDVAGDAVADQRVAALAEELQLAGHDLRPCGPWPRGTRSISDAWRSSRISVMRVIVEVDAQQRERARAASGRTPRGRGPRSPDRRRARCRARGWRWRSPLSLLRLSVALGAAPRPPGVLRAAACSGGGSTAPYLATTR